MRFALPDRKKLTLETVIPIRWATWIYAEGGAKTVWVNFPQQKSVPLPAWLRKLVE